MTPDKAIEILQIYCSGDSEVEPQDFQQAIQLGVEALKRIMELRRFRTLIGAASSIPGRLLPSEVEI